ncbi:hypothetical protein GCM10010211_49130 [Streptomyces albospinus]|uniref:Uncharacterized protein n=2 Tax=Streptomyces TaxID=1883 RepID=A0A101PBS4_9ACTN|nr:hypothetical protein [Streptomyces albospinus]KUN08570.1 hypothetical protein AQI95_09445 [Streptomyces yokosukanensis]GGU77383.1 hypothetical protein GCM10010211_49130 [Streptomyces albospinus]
MTPRPLPGTPGPRLQAIWEALDEREREAFERHLLQDTAAEDLVWILSRFGHRVSASTIRTYRRRLRQEATDS